MRDLLKHCLQARMYRQAMILILFCALVACHAKTSTPLMSCNELEKTRPLTHVHIQATISLTLLLDCTATSNQSDTYCYVPVGCDDLSLLLKRANERNAVFIPFNPKPNKTITDPDFDLKNMQVHTADGKVAGIGDLIDIEGDFNKRKVSGFNREISYIENAEIHLVPKGSSSGP